MNLRNVGVLSRFDLRYMLRSRETILWMFIMPVLFMFLIGRMTEARGGGGVPTMAVQDHDGGMLAADLCARIESLGYAVQRVDADTTLAKYSRQLTIPGGFTSGVLSGQPQNVEWFRKGSGTESGALDRVRVQRAAFQTLTSVIAIQSEGREVSPATLEELRSRPRAIDLEVVSGGKAFTAPDGFQQSVPGILVMFVVLVLMTTGGVHLVIEREEGLLRRLASTPVSRSEIVASKLVARILVAIVQATFAVLLGTFVFRISWGGRLPEIGLLLLVYGVAISVLSILFGNLARSRGQAVGLGVLSANVLGALGGCWWPIEVVPEMMQRIAWMLPTGWAMYGMHRLMNFGSGLESILIPLLLLSGFTVAVFFLARQTFRYE